MIKDYVQFLHRSDQGEDKGRPTHILHFHLTSNCSRT